jgi:hypothetical protein
MANVPDHENVKKMMNELYNGFYLKWRSILTLENAGQMMQEVHEIEKKYPFQLCRDILVGLVESIEEEYRKRGIQ